MNINAPGLVTVPSNGSGDYATLRFGLQHYLTEVAKFKFSEADTLSSQKMGEKLRKLEKYLTAAEKQIGAENVKSMHSPMMKVLFEGTSMEYLAETSTAWRDLIEELREYFQCPPVDETSLFYELLNLDCSKLTVKQALIKLYGIIQKAKAENVLSILPNPVIIVPKIVSWFPPTSHAMLKERFQDVAARTTWEELETDLKELTMETPPELRCGRTTSVSSRTSPTAATPKAAAIRPKTTGAIDETPTVKVTPTPTTQPRGPVVASIKTPTATNPAPKATATPKAKSKGLGRLLKNEEGFVGEFRIDTGADECIFGKDILGFVKSLGPSRSTYTTPLSSSHAVAEACTAEVTLTDVDGIEHPYTLRGVMNPGNNLSVLSVRTASFQKGVGTFQLDRLPGVDFPCHSRNAFPYAKVRFVDAAKSMSAFLSQLGFTSHPKPSIEDIATAVHYKFACAGTDTLHLQCAILGFAIPREVCRAVATACSNCPHKSLHAPLESIRSEDIIAPDVTEAT